LRELDKWVPRREEEGPKTIKEVHADAEKKERDRDKKARELDQRYMSYGNKKARDLDHQRHMSHGDNRDTRNSRDSHSRNKTVGTKNSKISEPTGEWQLTGRGKGRNVRSDNQKKPEGDTTNRFALLDSDESSPRKGKAKNTRTRKPEPENKNIKSTQPTISVSGDVDIVEPETKLSKSGPLSDVEIEQKTKILLDEYYDAQEIPIVIDCIKDYQSPEKHNLVIRTILLCSFVKNEYITLTVDLLAGLHKTSPNLISLEDFVTGYDKIFEEIQDLFCNNPRIGEFMGILIAHGILEGFLNKDYIHLDKVSALVRQGIAEKIISSLLSILLKKDVKVVAQDIYNRLSPIGSLLKAGNTPENIAKFLNVNGLESIDMKVDLK